MLHRKLSQTNHQIQNCFIKVAQFGMQFVKLKVKISFEALLHLIFAIRLLFFVTPYLSSVNCYLKLDIMCKFCSYPSFFNFGWLLGSEAVCFKTAKAENFHLEFLARATLLYNISCILPACRVTGF